MQVIACEINPDSLRALRHNLMTNRVADRCTVLAGDNLTHRHTYKVSLANRFFVYS